MQYAGGQLREMLRSVTCKCVENDWAEDLGSKPKLCILNSVCVNGFDGRCWKVREKSPDEAEWRSCPFPD